MAGAREWFRQQSQDKNQTNEKRDNTNQHATLVPLTEWGQSCVLSNFSTYVISWDVSVVWVSFSDVITGVSVLLTIKERLLITNNSTFQRQNRRLQITAQ